MLFFFSVGKNILSFSGNLPKDTYMIFQKKVDNFEEAKDILLTS